jgi:hypothetical protein
MFQSNFESLENCNQQIANNHFQTLHNPLRQSWLTRGEQIDRSLSRNVISENVPKNSRNSRKMEDGGSNTNFGNNGFGYGSYMNFSENKVRKDKNQHLYNNQESYSKQFENHFNTNFSNDIRKPMNSIQSVPLNMNNQTAYQPMTNYMFEHNMHYQYDVNKNLGIGIPVNSNQQYDRNGDLNGMGQRRRCAGVVQANNQKNMMDQYSFQNFETLNKIAEKEEEINRYMDRNPVNTRRDEVDKERLLDKKKFMNAQGTAMNNFNDLTPKNTRSDSRSIVQTNYIPNGRTLAQPRDLF